MSISALLWRYYLAFTLILIAIFFGTYWFWDNISLRLMGSPEAEELLQSAAFRHGSYGEINPEKYLGEKGGFAVLDGELNPIYSSSPYLPRVDTEDELLCIREYGSLDFFGSLPFRTEDGRQRLLVSCEHYDGDGLVSTDAALLDENLRVLEGSLFPGKKEFTREELSYLTGSWSRDYLLERAVAHSDLAPLKEQLCARLWRYGNSREPAQLVRSLCGGDFDAGHYTAYLRRKYTELYGL